MVIDIDKLRKLYKFSRNLTFQDAQVLIRAAKSRSFDAREYIQQEGSQDKTVFFIQQGMVRAFFLNERGDEITTWLRWENQIYINIDAALFERPSRFYAQTMEPTKVLTIDYDLLQDLIDQNPKLERNRKYFLRDILRTTISRNESFLLYSPEERYLHFIRQNPEIVNRVPDKYIANILGITPVSLSRIRKRIAQNQAKSY